MQSFQYVRHGKEEILIDFICKRFPYHTREKWLENINNAFLTINNNKVSPQTILINKDVTSYERPRSDEPEIDTNYQILFQDEFILVVIKNSNIPVSESGKYYKNTLINILKENENIKELFAVHRLDKETSGLLVIAKNKEIATVLGKQFSNQQTEKIYHAILLGNIQADELIVDKPLKKATEEQSKIRIRQAVLDGGKQSKTIFYPLTSDINLTLCKIKTLTGRTHQIRCHAEFIGHPILGDKLYGQSDDFFLDILKGKNKPIFKPYGILKRQLLHASSLTFNHPSTNEKVNFQADYKDEFSKYSFLKDLLTK